MKNSLSDSINTHAFPKLFFLFPSLLRLYHKVVFVSTLRNWYCARGIKKILKSAAGNFTLLDAGCGAGDYLIPAAKKHPSASFTGIDRAESNISVCNNYIVKKQINNCSFLNDDIDNLNSRPQFNYILCLTVLQYLDDDEAVLNRFYNALLPDGKLLLYVPVNYKSYFRFYEKFRNNRDKNSYDAVQGIKRKYKDNEILEKLSGANFKIVKSEFTYGTPGKMAFEIHSYFLHLIQSVSLIFVPLILLFYIPLIFPFTVLLNLADYFSGQKTGNGLLILAQKNPQN